jgi:hypothetical protein
MSRRLRTRDPPRGLCPRPVLDDRVLQQLLLILGRPPTTVDPKPDAVGFCVRRRPTQGLEQIRVELAHRRYLLVWSTETATPSGMKPSASSTTPSGMTASASPSAVCVAGDWPTSAADLDGADATSDRTTNPAIATPRIARLTSTILRVRRAAADSGAL